MSDLFIDPSRQTFGAFKDLPRDLPVEMLNLVALHDAAEYEDGRVATGAEAYAAYGKESGPIFRKFGGEIIWSATPEFMLIGPSDEAWDVAFVARYPTAQAFLDMVYDPDYQRAVKHRQAAVRTSRLIRTSPREAGAGFG